MSLRTRRSARCAVLVPSSYKSLIAYFVVLNCKKNNSRKCVLLGLRLRLLAHLMTDRFRRVAEAAATAAINLARPNYFTSSDKGIKLLQVSTFFDYIRRDL